jgi:hypothetical protein
MTGHKLRTWHRQSVGRVVITVSAEPPPAECRLAPYQRLAPLVDQWVNFFASVQLPATWGVGDPVHASVTSLIVTSGIAAGSEHEVAILADPSWSGIEAGRPRFSKELIRRVCQAQSKGIATTTLLPREVSLNHHIDLVVKQGVTAVWPLSTVAHNLTRTTVPKSLHYGLWEFATSGRLPLASGWRAGHRLQKSIRRAADEGATFQLFIDLPAIAQQGMAAEKTAFKVVQYITALRRRGILEVETVATAAHRLSEVPLATPQRSILRVAA